MKKSDLIFTVLRLPADFVALMAAALVAYVLRTEILSAYRPVLFQLNLPLARYLALSALASLAFLAAFAVAGLYSFQRLRAGQELGKIIVGCSAGILGVIIFIFLRQELFDSRFLVLGGWFFAIVCTAVGRGLMRIVRRHAVGRNGFGVHRLAIAGDSPAAEAIVSAIAADPASGYRIVCRAPGQNIAEVEALVASGGADEVLVADADIPSIRAAELAEVCAERHVVFKFVPNTYQTLATHVSFDVIAGMPVIELKRTPLDGWGRVAKRVFDIAAACGGLAVCLPVFAVAAVAIKIETRGPVFVRLKRVSRNREFGMIKFRSMIAVDKDGTAHSLNAYYRSLGNDRPDAGPLWKMKDDPRITRVGGFIRRFRIDEFPQFWNVLKGDMSMVGPRPHQPDEIARYQRRHKRVLAMKPGATGLVQISGSSDLPFEEEIALDIFYIEHWSLWLDVKILLRTALKIISRDRSAV